jgi:hypothetical protein
MKNDRKSKLDLDRSGDSTDVFWETGADPGSRLPEGSILGSRGWDQNNKKNQT